MSAVDKEPFPRTALIAAASLVGFSLLVTTAGRLMRITAPPEPAAAVQPAPARSVELRFLDEADGSVSVRDSLTGRRVAVIAPDSGGFVRGVMRGLARERRGLHIGAAPPFRLSQWGDGTLALIDTATRRRIDLGAFGASNKQAFVDLLQASGGPS